MGYPNVAILINLETPNGLIMRLPLLLFFLIAAATAAFAQKVKYKDIYALLSTRQYESAEVLLNRYLKDNTDNPNAYLYKGFIFQEKALKDDILKQTARTTANIDSAVMYMDRAYKSITEKEIKKNSEYYAAYNRRDLRTGEFGVTLSDIQFDLEKRMESLRERKGRIRMVTHYFNQAVAIYKRAQSHYTSLQAAYPGEKQLHLRADETTLQKLAVLGLQFDSCVRAFDQYKSSNAAIGKTGYNQLVEGREITDLAREGSSPADFFAPTVTLWDYAGFARRIKKGIEDDIFPMRKRLVDYDEELDSLEVHLLQENTSVTRQLKELTDRLRSEPFSTYDNGPLPAEVLALKIGRLAYHSLRIEQRANADTASIHVQRDMTQRALTAAGRVDSIANHLLQSDINGRALDYPHFVKETFGSTDDLKAFTATVKQQFERRKALQGERLAMQTEALRWIVAGTDSIPLFTGTLRSAYRPIVIDDERYAVGIYYADSLRPSGYLYSINAARTPEITVKFPVESEAFRQSRISRANALVYGDADGQLYYVLIYTHSTGSDNTVSASLAKIYKADGLAWAIDYKLEFIPARLEVSAGSGDITIAAENGKTMSMDKNGKPVK